MITIYPNFDHIINPYEKPLYFVEFNSDYNTFRLFKNNYVFTKEQYEDMKKKDQIHEYQSVLGHPYQLLSGKLLPDDCVAFETQSFLKHVVDALNSKEEIFNIKSNQITSQ